MRVLIISKACVVGQYQAKLEAIARDPDIRLTVVVPPEWKDERGTLPLERVHTDGYDLRIEPIALNGHFHLHYYPTLARIMSEVRPELVHIDEEPYNFSTFLAARTASRFSACPVFFTWQNIARAYPPPFSWMESYTFSKCHHAIAGNKEAVEVLRNKGYKGSITTIPQFGVDPLTFRPSARIDSFNSSVRIGFVGRFVKEKGPELLIRALSGVPGNWALEMIGHGPLLRQIIALVSDLRLESRVTIESWRPSTEMPSALQKLDMLIVPSQAQKNWKEQFGRVLIEAMACGIPVIGSSCGEIPNVIGDAGVTFPEGDMIALRKAITELLEDPEKRARLANLGRERVLSHFTQERIAAETCRFYREVLGLAPSLRSDAMRV